MIAYHYIIKLLIFFFNLLLKMFDYIYLFFDYAFQDKLMVINECFVKCGMYKNKIVSNIYSLVIY